MVSITNAEALELDSLFVALGDIKHLKTSWAVAQNRKKLDEHIKLFNGMLEPTAAMRKFEMEREKLAKVHAKKNPDGQAQIEVDPKNPRNARYMVEDIPAWGKAMAALLGEHPEAQEDREALDAKRVELLKETFEFEPYVLKLENTYNTSNPDESVLDAGTMFVLSKYGILKE